MNASIEPSGLPVIYEQACRLLAECREVGEAKYWNDRADALAVWAKIHKSERASIESRKLKLHAARRLGELAREKAPVSNRRGAGPRNYLQSQGFTRSEANIANRIALIPVERFASAVSSTAPPSPAGLVNKLNTKATDRASLMAALHNWHSMIQRTTTREFADAIKASNIQQKHRQRFEEVADWVEVVSRLLK